MNRWGLPCALLVASLLVSQGAWSQEVSSGSGVVRVEVLPGPACGSVDCEAPSGVLRIRSVGGEAAGEEAVVVRPLHAWGQLSAPLPPGAGFLLEVDDPRYWTPVVVRGRKAAEVTLRLHPVTDLEVGTPAPGEGGPEELRVAFSSEPTEQHPPGSPDGRRRASTSLQGEVQCQPGEETAVWRCPIPSGRMDLHFQARGFASEFRWAVPLEPFQVASVGRLDLVPGSSLLGWLQAAAGELPAEAHVELVPAGEPGGATGVRRLARRASVSERGLFQFRDLPAGLYRLQVQLPGWARAEVAPVEVLPEVETRLADPLVLQRPGSLSACVEPAFPPGVRLPEDTWRLRLDPREGRHPSIAEPVDSSGCLRLSDLQPGSYDLVLGDARGSTWEKRPLEMRSGEQQVEFRVEYFPIEGTLVRDGDALRALLEFRRLANGKGEDGLREGRKVDWFVDPEGRFEGALPEAGTWFVWARLRGGLKVELGSIEIEDKPGEVQELSLELPNTRLEGVVLDARGRPVEAASVWLTRKGAESERPWGFGGEIETDADGRYVFEGIVAGEYYLTAHRGPAWASAEATVPEEGPVQGPTLLLESTREVRGLVQGVHGGIPRAQLYVIPEPRDVPFRALTPIFTDVRGEFRVAVPTAATSLRVLVLAVGHGARVVRVPLRDESPPILLPMDRLSGTLRLEADPEAPLPHGHVLVVDGVPMSLSHLGGWARSMGGSLAPGAWVLPAMAPGDYRLCDRELEHCSGGFLGAGEMLVLTPG